MKKQLLTLIISFISAMAFAQQEYTTFTTAGRGVATTFVTDYQAIGINPANLGYKRTYENKAVTIGLLEGGASVYSQALSKSQLQQTYFDFKGNDLTNAQKVTAAANFANQPTSINAGMTWFGASYQHEKAGGFAFTIRDDFRFISQFSTQMSQLMFEGYGAPVFNTLTYSNGNTAANSYNAYTNANPNNPIVSGSTNTPFKLSSIFGNSKMSLIYYRSYNFGYGKEFVINDLLSINGGVDVKYLQGFGVLGASEKNGQLNAYGAFSPAFGINFGSASTNNPSADTSKVSGLPKSAGHGYGADLGLNVTYKEKWRLGVSVTNIGSITYNTNAYKLNDAAISSSTTGGINGYNFLTQIPNIVASGSSGLFKWQGQEKITVQLPTQLRIGLSQKLEDDRAHVGVDVVIPLNNAPGNLVTPYYALGGDFKPVRWIRLSAGFSHGGLFTSTVNIPLGITFIVGENGGWEFGVASRDFVSYFKNNGPAMSLAFGFMRFRF